MANQPLVSIIIPTYNRADLIGETLDSIIAQTYLNWECIVVDDGSTDNTSEVLKNYTKKDSRITYHHRPKNYKSGGNGARNYGFDISKGEFINWFDSDDVMLPNFISSKVECIEGKNMVICSHYITNSVLKIVKKEDIYIKTNILEDYLLWDDNFSIVTNNVLFLNKYINDSGIRFNEKILRGQEAYFFLNLWFHKPLTEDYQILNVPLFFYRQHGKSKSSDFNDKTKKFNLSIIEVHFLKLRIINLHNFIKPRQKVISFLKVFTIQIQKQRDLVASLFLIKNILSLKSYNALLLALIILALYPLNKFPKFLSNYWNKI